MASDDYPEPTFRMRALHVAGMGYGAGGIRVGRGWSRPNDPRLLKAGLMLSKEVRHKGELAVKNRKAAPGGWYFEFNNDFYPDVDDRRRC